MSEPQVRVGVGVFVIKDGKFLMQQRIGAHGAGTWSVPGGHLEFGETIEETAAREVFEETGVTITNIRFAAVTNDRFTTENKHYVTVWMISDWQQGQEYITEPDKCIAQGWYTLDTLPSPLFLPWEQLLSSEFIQVIATTVKRTA